MTFDALGRLTQKSGQNTSTDSFTHPSLSLISTASNSVQTDTMVVSHLTGADSTVTRIGGRRFRIYHTSNDGFLVPDTMTVTCKQGSPLVDCALAFPARRFHTDSANGILRSVYVGSFDPVIFHYDSELKRTTTLYPASVDRTESYTSLDSRYEGKFNSSTLNDPFRRAYRFDELGRISVEQRGHGDASQRRNFAYDGLGRLESVVNRRQGCLVWPGENADSLSADYGWRYVCGSTATSETFSYDQVGNRTSQSGSYGDGNRITALGNFTFEHDADGNITRRQNSATGQDRRYYWSAENLLDSVVTAGGDRVHYQYNAFGQPVVRKRNGSVERYFLYDRGHLLAELDASFNRVAEYIYVSVDQPLAMLTGSTTATGMEFYQQDELGNLIGRHSGGSVVGSAIIYGTWGASAQTELGWKGLRWEGDGVELYYMRARWYDPQIGRFMSEDPIGLAGGINQYTFAGNDPINGWDPAGLLPGYVLPGVTVWGWPSLSDVVNRLLTPLLAWHTDRSQIHSFSQFTSGPTGFRAATGDDVGEEAERACAIESFRLGAGFAADALAVGAIYRGARAVGRLAANYRTNLAFRGKGMWVPPADSRREPGGYRGCRDSDGASAWNQRSSSLSNWNPGPRWERRIRGCSSSCWHRYGAVLRVAGAGGQNRSGMQSRMRMPLPDEPKRDGKASAP